MNIRNMQAKDVDEVTKLEASCFSMPWKRHDFEEILTNPNRIYLVATEGEELLGGCMLTEIAGEGDISNVAVYENYRRKGIAKALLTELLRIGITEREIHDFTLEVREHNQAARRLYEELGFVSEGVRPNFYDKPKENAVIMWKRDGQQEKAVSRGKES